MADSKVRNSKEQEKEIWKPIKGYEGLYDVSSKGRIRSYYSGLGQHCEISEESTVLTPKKNKLGYLRIGITKNSKRGWYSIHRIVASVFIPNPENKPCVNHIDGNKANNDVTNLEWCTRSENIIHSYKTGLQVPKKGESHHNSKLSKQEVAQIKYLLENTNKTHLEIAELYGVVRSNITQISSGVAWSHVSSCTEKSKPEQVELFEPEGFAV